MEAKKHLGKGCYNHIKCSAANFLAVLMWKEFLNSAVLAIPTHRRGVWWDKHSSSGLNDQQVENQDHSKGTI